MKEISQELIEKILDSVDNKPEESKISIKELNEQLIEGTLVIDHTYQRKYLYEEKYKVPSKFVESIFMGLIIPEVQLFRCLKHQKVIREIIDGQQRILSLVNYYNNKFPLEGLTVLKELNGLYYKELPEALREIFKTFQVNARIVKKNNEFKFDMFERLNTGSKQLNKQEIRNCIYRGKMMTLAKELSDNNEVQRVFYGLKEDRFERTEVILRVLSIVYNDCRQLHGTSSSNINKFLESESVKNIDDKKIDEIKVRFIKTCSIINQSFDLPKIFKQISNSNCVSKTHIDPIFVSIYRLEDKNNVLLNATKIRESLIETFEHNPAYIQTTINNATNALNTNTRISIVSTLINDIISNSEVKLDPKRTFTIEEKFELWQQEKLKNGKIICPICGNEIFMFNDAEVDHIIPWSKGGRTVLSNAQITHKICNKLKSNTL